VLEVHRLVQRRAEPQGDGMLQTLRQRERALKQALQVIAISFTPPPLSPRNPSTDPSPPWPLCKWAWPLQLRISLLCGSAKTAQPLPAGCAVGAPKREDTPRARSGGPCCC